MKHRIAVLLSIVLFLAFCGCYWFGQNADLVLKNGVVFTGNPEKPFAEAVAVHRDRILLVGDNDDVDRFVGPKTRSVDLKGRFACAGFNDAHVHLYNGGKQADELDLTGVRSVEELQQRILKPAWELASKQPGAWLVGRGWDQTLFPDQKWPTKRALDAVAPDVPMFFLRVCGHVALVNGKALEIARITASVPDPPSGQIERDASTGQPTGILKEQAIRLVSQYFPMPGKQVLETIALRALDDARRLGLTSLQDSSPSEIYDVYRSLLQQGRLTSRISVWLPLDEQLDRIKAFRQRFDHPMLRFGLLKGFADGTLGARTALLSAPYSDEPGTIGLATMSLEDLYFLILRADREGFPVGVHAIGDQACSMVLDVFSLARRVNDPSGVRHRIEHAQVLLQSDLPRFKELGVVASMQPSHCIEDLRWAQLRLGPSRSRTAYAWKSLLSQGTPLAFGSDWPVAPLNPLVGIYAAVTRRDTTGFPPNGWIPRQRLTVQEALEAYTKGSAFAEGLEADKGTVEKGKLADIVVLTQNPLRVSPRRLLATRVWMTVCNGKVVYEAASPP